jgi:hypothetical protein
MAKDKKKKKDKKDASPKPGKVARKAVKKVKALAENPLVADVVAAALVAMASALKDSDKARRLASDAGEQLDAMSKKSAKQGNVMWELALDVGRRALETLATEEGNRAKPRK